MPRAHFHLVLTLLTALVCLAAAVRGPVVQAPQVVESQDVGGKVDFVCSACLFASAEADKVLHKNTSYIAFKDYVEHRICNDFRLIPRLLCKKVAPKLLPAIYEWAEKFLETGRACGAFCHGSDTVNSTCSLCEYGCQSVHTFLGQPDQQDKALTFAESVCPLFAPEYQPKCVQDIESFGPEVLDFIEQVTANPRDTCNKLKFCLQPAPPPNATLVQ